MEERQRTKGGGGSGEKEDGDMMSGTMLDMPVSSIREAELLSDAAEDSKPKVKAESPVEGLLGCTASQQVNQLVVWAKRIPHFTDLPVRDQMLLLKNGWNELLIAAFSHRSINCTDGISLADGVIVNRSNAQQYGVGLIYDRVLTELVAKMRDMKMDKVELGCLRTIVLYNPDVRGLSCSKHIECLRERVYSTLEAYTKKCYESEGGRFPKLLMRLPALRSIGLRCFEHLFYMEMFLDESSSSTHIESYLLTKLQQDDQLSSASL